MDVQKKMAGKPLIHMLFFHRLGMGGKEDDPACRSGPGSISESSSGFR